MTETDEKRDQESEERKEQGDDVGGEGRKNKIVLIQSEEPEQS